MGDVSARWRAPLAIVGAVCLVVGVLVLVLAGGEARAPGPSGASAVSAARPTPPPTSPIGAGGGSGAASPRGAAASSPTAAGSVVWPEPSVPIPYKATKDPSFGDPFESDAGLPSDVRVLATVGAFRLGVTNESKVRDERAVAGVLRDLGGEIDALDRGRTDSYERRVVEYQAVYERYRPKLAPFMDGAFALKGNGWTDTERLEPPPAASSASATARASAGVGHAP